MRRRPRCAGRSASSPGAAAEGRAMRLLAAMLLALLVLVVLAESLAGNWLLGRNTKVQA